MERRTFLKLAGVAMLVPVVPDWPEPKPLPPSKAPIIGGNVSWAGNHEKGYWGERVTPNGGNITVMLPNHESVIFPAVVGNEVRVWWDGADRVELIET